jgi:glutathione S-transferase
MMSVGRVKIVVTGTRKIFQKYQFSSAVVSEVLVPNKLNLYGNPRSQPTRSVLMLLREAKIEHVFHQLNNREGEHRKPEYKNVLPAGLLPSIVTTDGIALGEGAAILQYLVDRYDIKEYTSTDVNTRARINFWLHWNHTNTRNGTMKILVPEILYPPKTDIEATLAKGQKAHVRNCKFITKHLEESGNKFLATSSAPSIADLMIVPELDQLSAKGYRLFDYTPFPRIEQYISDVRAAVRSYDETFLPVVEKGEELAALKARK